jgi:hypothetical protein
MNYIIKQIILLSIIFILILWFQQNEKKDKEKDKNISLYNKIKLPLLVCSIIGFILNLNIKFNNNIDVALIDNCNNDDILINNNENIFKSSINNTSDKNLLIYTDLPEF